MSGKYEGTIKKKKEENGYGFIKGADGKDVFFHCTGCATPFTELAEGDKVKFDVDPESEKGPRGINVTKVK